MLYIKSSRVIQKSVHINIESKLYLLIQIDSILQLPRKIYCKNQVKLFFIERDDDGPPNSTYHLLFKQESDLVIFIRRILELRIIHPNHDLSNRSYFAFT